MFWLNWSGYPGCLKVTVCSGRPPPKLLSGRAGCAGTGCLRMIWADGVLENGPVFIFYRYATSLIVCCRGMCIVKRIRPLFVWRVKSPRCRIPPTRGSPGLTFPHCNRITTSAICLQATPDRYRRTRHKQRRMHAIWGRPAREAAACRK
jgi:hypothetical protein